MAKKEVDVGPLIVGFYLEMVLNHLELIKKLGMCFLLSPKGLYFLKAGRRKSTHFSLKLLQGFSHLFQWELNSTRGGHFILF